MRFYTKTNKRHGSGNSAGTSPAGYRDATDLEDAAHAINKINRRTRQDARDRELLAKAKVSLSHALDAWLKNDVP